MSNRQVTNVLSSITLVVKLITVLNLVLFVRTLCMINANDQVYGVGLET